jgi:hypothetical protein
MRPRAGRPGRHDHHASPDHQPQPHPRRGDQAALLLPARRQARKAPAGFAPRRDLGLAAVFPGHRLCPTCRCAEGTCLRLRGLLHGHEHDVPSGACVRGRRCLGPSWRASSRAMVRPSTACRRTRHDHGWKSGPKPAPWPEKIHAEPGPVTVFQPGFPVHWHVVPEFRLRRSSLAKDREMIPSAFPPKDEIARLTARALLEIKAVHFNAETPFTLASGPALAHLHRLPQADQLPAHPVHVDGFPGRHRDARGGVRGLRQHRRWRDGGHSLRRAGGRTACAANDLRAQEAQGLWPQRPDRGRDDRRPARAAGRGSDHRRRLEAVLRRCDPRNGG